MFILASASLPKYKFSERTFSSLESAKFVRFVVSIVVFLLFIEFSRKLELELIAATNCFDFKHCMRIGMRIAVIDNRESFLDMVDEASVLSGRFLWIGIRGKQQLMCNLDYYKVSNIDIA